MGDKTSMAFLVSVVERNLGFIRAAENTLPFKGRDRVGMGLFSNETKFHRSKTSI
ncbi:MAG: hypothetical protein IT392_10910 [Nitrospirae bacterium]|nr:hypothetical protein [Nitrospirota bacterium]